MPSQAANVANRNLSPEEVVLTFRLRYRICRNLRWTGLAWAAFGALMYWYGEAKHFGRVSVAGFCLFMIGVALGTAVWAVEQAILRCPVCDAPVGHVTKILYCRKCPARLR